MKIVVDNFEVSNEYGHLRLSHDDGWPEQSFTRHMSWETARALGLALMEISDQSRRLEKRTKSR